jgi:glycosyltransferase involved in cell wall biosynthesis
MKISIIIPVHNLENEIVQCLESIAAQDFDKREYEVLLILDSCTDGSERTIHTWHNEHNDIILHIFYSQCKTPGGARNIGLDMAEGEYILFIDGDDYLINNSAMSLLYNAIQGHNAVRVMDHERSGTHVKFSNRLTLWLHFFSRELIGESRMTDMLLNEDYEFVKRIRNKPEYNEVQLFTPLYYYNYDEERMIQRIKQVRQETYERRKQGLPALYVSDEFRGR